VSDNFYKAFEDKYRGSRDIIKTRLSIYLPFVEPLKQHYPESQTIDLGCGRGEWLELLSEMGGFNAHGVDLDEGMLDVCKKHQLNYTQQDALTYLQALEDESQTIVTGFHIAEHILFEDLKQLIQQALRVLKPAGLLILETPNPENIVVSTSDFYMDPTHNQPIPPNLLAFIPEYYGFKQTKIVRLQEEQSLIGGKELALFDVLKGVSPDYAIIAQKERPEELEKIYKPIFEKVYGISLESLAKEYSRQAESKIKQAQLKLHAIDLKAQAAEARSQAAEARSQAAEERNFKLLNSKSWKYTQPLRQVIAFIKKLVR